MDITDGAPCQEKNYSEILEVEKGAHQPRRGQTDQKVPALGATGCVVAGAQRVRTDPFSVPNHSVIAVGLGRRPPLRATLRAGPFALKRRKSAQTSPS